MITPIIMEADIERVNKKMELLRKQNNLGVHVDIGDGLFSDLLTIAPADLQQIERGDIQIDFHLMVDDPTEWVEECVALSPKRVIAQIEHMGSQKYFLETVASYGSQGGLALEMTTPIEEIEKEVLGSVETIFLLGVETGKSGEKFNTKILDKVRALRAIYKGNILVDGGVDPKIWELAAQAGADEGASNSAWWRGEYGEK